MQIPFTSRELLSLSTKIVMRRPKRGHGAIGGTRVSCWCVLVPILVSAVVFLDLGVYLYNQRSPAFWHTLVKRKGRSLDYIPRHHFQTWSAAPKSQRCSRSQPLQTRFFTRQSPSVPENSKFCLMLRLLWIVQNRI